jgi:hypothetical protein
MYHKKNGKNGTVTAHRSIQAVRVLQDCSQASSFVGFAEPYLVTEAILRIICK